MGALQVLNSESREGFHLLRRARHVASEAARVWRFRGVCESEAGAPAKLAQLGASLPAPSRPSLHQPSPASCWCPCMLEGKGRGFEGGRGGGDSVATSTALFLVPLLCVPLDFS